MIKRFLENIKNYFQRKEKPIKKEINVVKSEEVKIENKELEEFVKVIIDFLENNSYLNYKPKILYKKISRKHPFKLYIYTRKRYSYDIDNNENRFFTKLTFLFSKNEIEFKFFIKIDEYDENEIKKIILQKILKSKNLEFFLENINMINNYLKKQITKEKIKKF